MTGRVDKSGISAGILAASLVAVVLSTASPFTAAYAQGSVSARAAASEHRVDLGTDSPQSIKNTHRHRRHRPTTPTTTKPTSTPTTKPAAKPTTKATSGSTTTTTPAPVVKAKGKLAFTGAPLWLWPKGVFLGAGSMLTGSVLLVWRRRGARRVSVNPDQGRVLEEEGVAGSRFSEGDELPSLATLGCKHRFHSVLAAFAVPIR